MHINRVYLKRDKLQKKLFKRDCGVHLHQQVPGLLVFLTTVSSLNAWSEAPPHVQFNRLLLTPKPRHWRKILLYATSLLGSLNWKILSTCTFIFDFLGRDHTLIDRPTVVQFSGVPVCHKHAAKTSAFLLSDLNYILQASLNVWLTLSNHLHILLCDKECFKERRNWFCNLYIWTPALLEDLSSGARSSTFPGGEKDGE